MGKVNVLEELQKDNKRANAVELQVYGDALVTYVEASTNVDKNGAICSHPRTGAPLENPYLKVRAAAGLTLAKMKGIRGDRVLQLLQAQTGAGERST